eukprot:gene9800-6877_t
MWRLLGSPRRLVCRPQRSQPKGRDHREAVLPSCCCSSSSAVSRPLCAHSCAGRSSPSGGGWRWMRKTFGTTTPAPSLLLATAAATGALHTVCRGVHERPYMEVPLPPRHTRGPTSRQQKATDMEAYEAAKDALLQFNLMVRRGIEPDALMYTSLIATMGRAGLEWQAYKLFSRMVESKIRPLPETYVALRDATDPSRKSLREDIKTKIEESITVFPEAIAEAELERQRKEDAACWEKFEACLRGELPAPPADTPTASSAMGEDPNNEADAPPPATEATPPAPPLGTVHIRHPRDVWNTAELVENLEHQKSARVADGADRQKLSTALHRLHEEELRIFATIHRQLRHGDKAALVERVLDAVPANTIAEMLRRRSYYFRSVEKILAADLEEVQRLQKEQQEKQGGTKGSDRVEEEEREGGAAAVLPPRDFTTTAGEKDAFTPEVLYTPWGFIRKPGKSRGTSAAATASKSEKMNEERLLRLQLSEEELLLLRVKAEAGDLDEVPEQLLRRYAFQFRLRWRRKYPLSLLESVAWHLTTFFSLQTVEDEMEMATTPAGVGKEAPAPSGEKSTGKRKQLVVVAATPPPTPALRRQREQQGMTKTLENFEAFRIIAQRTENLQVVDHKEINLHLHKVRREARQAERRVLDARRREEHQMAAAAMVHAATQFDGPSLSVETDAMGHSDSHIAGSQVLGWDAPAPAPSEDPGEANTSALTHMSEGESEDEEAPSEEPSPRDELPPWELGAGEDEFDLESGHFGGSPEWGRYRELSDSRVRLLPSQAGQKAWRVDEALLPTTLKGSVAAARLEAQSRQEAVEKEYQRRSHYATYRKWDRLLQRGEAKKRSEQEERAQEVESGKGFRPTPASKRLAQILRRGSDRQKVSAAMREKYNRPL